LKPTAGKVSRVLSHSEEFTADEYIVAGGSWSPAIGKLLGIKDIVDAGQRLFF
jgi:D-amino-acid dehydrogenase